VTSVTPEGSLSSYKKGCKMSEAQDFERAWLAKFSSCLDRIVGEEIRKEVKNYHHILAAKE